MCELCFSYPPPSLCASGFVADFKGFLPAAARRGMCVNCIARCIIVTLLQQHCCHIICMYAAYEKGWGSEGASVMNEVGSERDV